MKGSIEAIFEIVIHLSINSRFVLGFLVTKIPMCEIFANQPQESYEPITRNIRLNGQSTSIRLERSFWAIVDTMAEEEGVSTPTFLSTLHSEVLEIHGEAKNFTSLLRCACVKKMQLITLNPSSNLLVRSAKTNEKLKNFFP